MCRVAGTVRQSDGNSLFVIRDSLFAYRFPPTANCFFAADYADCRRWLALCYEVQPMRWSAVSSTLLRARQVTCLGERRWAWLFKRA